MIAPIVTRGFGSFGGVNLLPTRGYGIAATLVLAPGGKVALAQAFLPGAVRQQAQVPGAQRQRAFVPGAVDVEVFS